MFQKVLIARRGEAAARVARTCKRLGIDAVALFSEAAESVHVEACDVAKEVQAEDGRVATTDVLAAAREAGVDAVYPGYASYTAHQELARLFEAEGLPFVGLDPDLLDLVRDRIRFREVCDAAGVQPVPGGPAESLSDAYDLAHQIGFPVLVKGPLASMGVGLHLARDEEELKPAWEAARAKVAEGPLVVERRIDRARDIEVLVAADSHGEESAFTECETSIVSEGRGLLRECPSPELVFRTDGEALREMMYDLAIRLTRQLAHIGVLGVRMLVDPDGRIYVRGARLGLPNLHGAPEMVTQLDLVELQLRLASGEPVPDEVRQLQPSGHAVTVQVLAEEDAQRRESVEELRFPSLPQRTTRVEPSVAAGTNVPPDDWPRLAKITCFAPIRHQSILTLDRVLAATQAPPMKTNVPTLRRVLIHEGFRAGQYDCDLVDALMAEQEKPKPAPESKPKPKPRSRSRSRSKSKR